MIFDFTADYILEDEVVLLRPLTVTDDEHLLEYAVNEPDIWSFNSGGADSMENLKKYIETALDQRQQQRQYAFIVFDKRAGKYVGSTRFYNMEPEKKTLEVGFTWYGKSFQGTGINKNCKYLLFSFVFDQLGWERIGLGANSKNQRSINAMKGVGCTVEGVLRSRGYDAQGERIDSIILSILKQEWLQEWKEKLLQKTIAQ